MESLQQRLDEAFWFNAMGIKIGSTLQGFRATPTKHAPQQLQNALLVGESKKIFNGIKLNGTRSMGDHLIQKRKRVPHRPFGGPHNLRKTLGIKRGVFFLQDRDQVCREYIVGYPLQIVALATAKDGCGNFPRLRRGKNKFYMGRWLFQSLQ